MQKITTYVIFTDTWKVLQVIHQLAKTHQDTHGGCLHFESQGTTHQMVHFSSWQSSTFMLFLLIKKSFHSSIKLSFLVCAFQCNHSQNNSSGVWRLNLGSGHNKPMNDNFSGMWLSRAGSCGAPVQGWVTFLTSKKEKLSILCQHSWENLLLTIHSGGTTLLREDNLVSDHMSASCPEHAVTRLCLPIMLSV